MRIVLELDSEKALYQQIRDAVVEGIATGTLRSGESLPSTRQLAADFGINFHTVNKAYDLLRQEGLLRLNRKTGAIVRVEELTEPQRLDWQANLRVLLAGAFVKGLPRAEILQTCEQMLADFIDPPVGSDANQMDGETGDR